MNRNGMMQGALGFAVVIAGAVTAQGGVATPPTVDGQLDVVYGAPVAQQGVNVIDILGAPTLDFCGAVNNSNVQGKGAYEITGTETALPFPSDPATVLTGIEFSIPLAELDYDPGFGTDIRVVGFVNGSGHDFLSNQLLGGFGTGLDPENLGEPRGLSLADQPGNQFVEIDVSIPNRVPVGVVMDGQVDAAYGMNPVWVQNIGTGFGDSNNPAADIANGSELDAVWAYVDTAANLNMIITGNMETNFNKLELFFDVKNGGQNELVGIANPDIDFNALRRMGNNVDGSLDMVTGGPTGMDATGLMFDAGFQADYYITYTTGDAGNPQHYVSAAFLTPNDGTGNFVGGGQIGSFPVITGAGPRGNDILVSLDNSNVLGVGGRSAVSGSGSLADGTPGPGSVTTGLEFKVNLEALGYDTSVFAGARGATPENILIGGFLLGQNWDFLSNQIIGGITSFEGDPGTPANDPGNLGGPAKQQNWDSWDGNQYVSLPVTSTTLNDPGITIDGTVSMGETLLGGNPNGYIQLWVNTTNGTGFEDSSLGDPFEADGSELCATYARVGLDNGVPTLFVAHTGNFHDFNRMVTFFDVNPSLNATTPVGQNDLRGDNANIDGDGLNRGLGGPDGMTFDTGFWPDYVVSYATGGVDENGDQTTDFTRHFAHGAQLLTDGGGFGGPIGNEEENSVSDPLLQGSYEARIGLGDNDDATLELANGTELDAAYVYVDTGDGFAYFFFAGNFEANFTNLEIFFDTLTGAGVGQNTLINDNPLTPEADGNPDTDFGSLQRMGRLVEVDNSDPMNPIVVELEPGLTFEDGFEADYYLSVRLGDVDVQGNTASIYGNWARLGDGSSDPGEQRFLGAGTPGGGGTLEGGTVEQSGLGFEETLIDVDNSNVGGVIGGADPFFDTMSPPMPENVMTGMEIAVELADLGWDGESEMRFFAFINGAGHASIGNQTLPHICGEDPGEPRLVDFSDDSTYPGEQYISYPTPIAAPPVCEAPPSLCEGDANKDGAVDVNDLSFVIFRIGNTGACADGDANGDGIVDVNDLSFVIFRLGDLPADPCAPTPCP